MKWNVQSKYTNYERRNPYKEAFISRNLNIGKYIHDLKLQYKEKDKQVIAKNCHD